MIVDAHNHVNWLGYGPERIVENMDQQGIDVTWLLSWEAPLDEIDQGFYMKIFYPGRACLPFTDVLAAVSRFPDRFLAGYCPDPRRPDSVDRLEAAVEGLGVKVCGELKLRMMLDNLDALRLYRACAEHSLPVVVHLDYPVPVGQGDYPRPDYWYGGGLEPFENALKKSPDTLFVGHGPGFWGHISKDEKYLEQYYPTGPVLPGGELFRLLREFPNLYADLSAESAINALSRDHQVGKDFLIEFQDRLMFARDCFTDRLISLLHGYSLPREVLEKILSGNALSLTAKQKS